MVTQFGSGQLWCVPTLFQSAAVANPTPQNFGILQDVQVDFAEDVKELHGQLKFPVDVSTGKAKITGKAKMANVSGSLLASLYFGETLAAGQNLETDETNPIPSTPFQLTVIQTATFVRDLGVKYVASGLFLLRVASAPAAGQYTVSAVGLYTFAAADVGLSVTISYTYNSAATGKSFTITNRLMGDKPEFECWLVQKRKGKNTLTKLNRCISTKISHPTKLEDFTIEEFDFSSFDDGTGVVGSVHNLE